MLVTLLDDAICRSFSVVDFVVCSHLKLDVQEIQIELPVLGGQNLFCIEHEHFVHVILENRISELTFLHKFCQIILLCTEPTCNSGNNNT